MGLESVTLGQLGASTAINLGERALSAGAVGRSLDYFTNYASPNRIPDPADLLTLRRRGVISDKQFLDGFRAHGYNAEATELLKSASSNILGPADLILLYRRGEIDIARLYTEMYVVGFAATEVDRLLKVSEYTPGPSDILHFAVKDVYSPNAGKLGLYEDYPGDSGASGASQFNEDLKATGIQPSIARKYWAAHWALPSPSQVFEMLHRRLISEKDVQDYLRSADYSPAWRDLMTKISYNPLTRVDVRRAYALGVIDAETVYNTYRDEGYNDENAKILQEFVIRDVADDNNGLTKSLIVQSYSKQLIDRDTAVQMFKALKYEDSIIELTLDLADYQTRLREIDVAETELTLQYNKGLIGIEEIRSILRTYQVDETYVAKFLAKIQLQSYSKRKNPTVADLKRWLKQKLITEELFINRLELAGYSTEDASLYARETTIDPTMAGGG